MLSDIPQADRDDLAAAILLDLSVAFDMVDHSVLLERLQQTLGIGDTAFCWFQSYLSSRKQYIRQGSIKSSVTYLICGMPQGSVLGLILFVLCTADLLRVTDSHTCMPTTRRYMDFVGHLWQQHLQQTSPTVLKQPLPRCD